MSIIVDLRKQAAETVARWITEMQGEEVASAWAWECTPMPCGLPSDEQLQEGLSLALGEVSIGALLAKTYREMEEEMRRYNESQGNSADGKDK